MRARSVFHAALLSVLVLGVACTGDEPPATTTTPSASSPSVSTPTGPVVFVPGEYAIDLSGVQASLSLEDAAGTMTVRNGSSIDLGQASLDVISGDGSVRADATLVGPGAVAIGEEATYEVDLPAGVMVEDIGLVRLSFDGVSLALFAPVVATD